MSLDPAIRPVATGRNRDGELELGEDRLVSAARRVEVEEDLGLQPPRIGAQNRIGMRRLGM
jgi:hypothetical protein